MAQRIVSKIEALAASTNLSIRQQIQEQLSGRVSRGDGGGITKRVRASSSPLFCPPSHVSPT